MVLEELDKYMIKNKTSTFFHIKKKNKKQNSNYFKDLNVRTETIKPPRKHPGSIFIDGGPGNIILDLSPQKREANAKMF